MSTFMYLSPKQFTILVFLVKIMSRYSCWRSGSEGEITLRAISCVACERIDQEVSFQWSWIQRLKSGIFFFKLLFEGPGEIGGGKGGAGFCPLASPSPDLLLLMDTEMYLFQFPSGGGPWWEGYLQLILELVELQQTKRFLQMSRIKCLRKRVPRHFSFWTVSSEPVQIWYSTIKYIKSLNSVLIAEFYFVILKFSDTNSCQFVKLNFQTITELRKDWVNIDNTVSIFSFYDDSNSHEH